MRGKTIAEALREEGREEGRKIGEIRSLRQILLRQLPQRFGELPRKIVETIEATEDVTQLDAWLDRIVTARKLAEMGIAPR